jgi:hypothetical protein
MVKGNQMKNTAKIAKRMKRMGEGETFVSVRKERCALALIV